MSSPINYDKTVKEWTVMLTYISGTYTGSIKALAQANDLDYSRCIRMNKSLKKKMNKIAYVNSLIQKYTDLRDSVIPVVVEPVMAEQVLVPEPVVVEPVVTEPVVEPVPEPVSEPVTVPEPINIVSSPVNLITSPSSAVNLTTQPPFSFDLDIPEYITKKDFDIYRKNVNATLDSIIETQNYSDALTGVIVFTVGVIGILFYLSLTHKSSFRT
jgi:hypothetical protein